MFDMASEFSQRAFAKAAQPELMFVELVPDSPFRLAHLNGRILPIERERWVRICQFDWHRVRSEMAHGLFFFVFRGWNDGQREVHSLEDFLLGRCHIGELDSRLIVGEYLADFFPLLREFDGVCIRGLCEVNV